MILYHSTDESLLETIKTEGLKPGKDSYRDWVSILGLETPTENCVWFSTDPAWNLHTFHAFFATPHISVSVDIDCKDNKLLKLATLLQKAKQWVGQQPVVKQTGKTCYLYLGTVPPDKFINVQPIIYTFPDGSTARTWDDLEAYRKRTA
jgi:hypothetical protein